MHGFKDRDNEAAVVSAGSALQPHRIENAFVEALSPILRPQGLVLPAEEALDLAGRKNVQGKGLSSHARFVHLELSHTVRTTLLNNSNLRSEVGASMKAVEEVTR